MTGCKQFIKANAFSEMNGVFYGMFGDMHMVLKAEGEFVSAYLYLDLPPAGRKARKDLESQMNEKGERYNARISGNAPSGFLKIELQNDEETGVNLDRFLTECDLLLRPYGREMGLLCAYCRKEMQEIRPEYKMENGLVVPVCPDCANLESAGRAKKADNRRTLEKKRMTRGVAGAMIGCIISAGIWLLLSFSGGLFISFLGALAGVFLIRFMFEKFSRTANRLTPCAIMAFALFALVLGNAVGYTIRTNEFYEDIREMAAYEIAYPESENNTPGAYFEDADSVVYGKISITDTLTRPAFYQELILPAVMIVILSFSSGGLNLKSRNKRS